MASFLSSFALQASENDSLPYTLYKKKLVLFADYGFNSAPFNLKDDFGSGIKKIQYKTNLKSVLGFGLSYKWFSLRVGFTLPGNIRPVKDFGETQYFDAGIHFSIKQAYASIDLRTYKSYAVKNANQWNDTLPPNTKNAIDTSMQATSLSFDLWFFRNKDLRMPPVLGKVGHYDREAKTWYFKGTLNFFGINNGNSTIIPSELVDTTDLRRTNTIGAIDFGFVPGYAYVNRIKNWQFSIFAGLGGVIQANFFEKRDNHLTEEVEGGNESHITLAPRLDLRALLGYSIPQYFVFLTSDFDIKSLKIQELSYNQMFYNVKLVTGFRIGKHKPKRTK